MFECKPSPVQYTIEGNINKPIVEDQKQVISRSFHLLFQKGSSPSVSVKVSDNMVDKDVDASVPISELTSKGLVTSRQTYRRIFGSHILSEENKRWANVITESMLPDSIRDSVINDIFDNLLAKDVQLRKFSVSSPTKTYKPEAGEGCGYNMTAHAVIMREDATIMLSSFKLFNEIRWALPFGKVFHGTGVVESLKQSVKKYFDIDLSDPVDTIGVVFSQINEQKVVNIGFRFFLQNEVEDKENVMWVKPEEIPGESTVITADLVQKHLNGEQIEIGEI